LGKHLASFIDISETAIDLDLSQVEFIDSRGTHEHIVARRAGLRIMITAASPTGRRTLDVAGINGYLSE
jgi:anti-anti-sigma regulatory factor